MSVKRYEVNGSSSIFENENGSLVDYDDYAALEAKCEALAAENAGLIKFCKDAAFDADYEAELGMERGGFTDALNAIKTPATDAFLAEVRAQGVERLAKAWYAIANETDPGISISDSSRLKYRQRADDAADFANEIRQEAAQ